jgi:PadR family transcriptional regulator, regulatory protein PadR
LPNQNKALEAIPLRFFHNTNTLDILCITQYNAVNGELMTNESFENAILELRRGVIVLVVLSNLSQEQYGYSLINELKEHGLEIDQGTLYPLLRRLESQGLLQSNWRIEGDHPRRYYVLSDEGRTLLPRLKEEWNNIVSMMEKML